MRQTILLVVIRERGQRFTGMPESGKDIVDRCPPSTVGGGPDENQRQIPQIGRGFFQLVETSHAHDGCDRLVPTGHHQIRPLLRVGHQTATPRCAASVIRELGRIMKNSHTKTI